LIKSFDVAIIFEAIDKFSATMRKIDSGLQSFHKHAERVARSAADIGLKTGAFAVGIGAGLTALIKPAVNMQGEWAHVATAVDDGVQTLAHLQDAQERVNQLARTGVISQMQLAEGFYISRSAGFDQANALEAIASAQRLVTATTANAADANAQYAPTVRLVAEMAQNFHMTPGAVADMLANAQTHKAFLNIGEIIGAGTYLSPAALGAKMSLPQSLAALSVLSKKGLHGPEGGTAFEEVAAKLNTGAKVQQFVVRNAAGGVDLPPTLAKIQDYLNRIPAAQQGLALRGLGFDMRDVRGLTFLLEGQQDLIKSTQDFAHSQDAAAIAEKTRLAAADEQWAMAINRFDAAREVLGNQLLPAVTKLITKFSDLIDKVTVFAQAHPDFVRWALEATALVGALSGVTSIIAFSIWGVLRFIDGISEAKEKLASLGDVSLMTWGWIAAAVVLAVVAYEIYKHWDRVVKLWSDISSSTFFMVLTAYAQNAWHAIKAVGGAIESVFGFIWRHIGAVAAFMVGGPLGLAAYEIYKHWGGIKDFFGNLWTGIKTRWHDQWAALKLVFSEAWTSLESTFARWGDEMYQLGGKLLHELARGIKATALAPVHALEAIGKDVMRYLPWHSPAETGPLAHLDRVHIIETIAQTVRPAPLVAAMSGALMMMPAIAPAMTVPPPLLHAAVSLPLGPREAPPLLPAIAPPPMILHTVTSLPVVPREAPIIVPRETVRERTPGRQPVNVVLNYTAHYHGVMPDEADARRHAEKIMRLIKERANREERLRFE
jgi:TP901 family phage tail tape measure protein